MTTVDVSAATCWATRPRRAVATRARAAACPRRSWSGPPRSARLCAPKCTLPEPDQLRPRLVWQCERLLFFIHVACLHFPAFYHVAYIQRAICLCCCCYIVCVCFRFFVVFHCWILSWLFPMVVIFLLYFVIHGLYRTWLCYDERSIGSFCYRFYHVLLLIMVSDVPIFLVFRSKLDCSIRIFVLIDIR